MKLCRSMPNLWAKYNFFLFTLEVKDNLVQKMWLTMIRQRTY